MNKLTIIVHGRSASTLMLKLLQSTHEFTLWGGSPTDECGVFRNHPETWHEETIRREWGKVDKSKPVLAKLPAFAYFIEEMLTLEPDVIVLERPIMDIVKSYAAVGWMTDVLDKHREWDILEKASKKYSELGGVNTDDPYHRLAVVFAWSHWKTRRALEHYPRKLFIHYRDFMEDPYAVIDRLEDFLDIEIHREEWIHLMKNRHQATGRPPILNYSATLSIQIPKLSPKRICDATQRFGCL